MKTESNNNNNNNYYNFNNECPDGKQYKNYTF